MVSNRIKDRMPWAFSSLVTLALVLTTWLTLAPSATGIESVTSGGGEYTLPTTAPHISEVQRQRVQAAIQENIERLGLNARAPVAPGQVALGWPLQPAGGMDDYGYHGISGFVDHDPTYPNHLLDYNCGDRTYDLSSGYNHQGTDVFTWPFPWTKMDQDQVQVVAAADGIIVYREDGNYDRNCGFGQGDANAIVLLHSDGSATWYWHMKKDSVTSKGVFDTVTQGEYLGVVGSSGYSTGPHLHFEVYAGFDWFTWEGQLIDPYQGTCNSLNAESWWETQPPYYDPAVNKLTTGTAPPDLLNCGSEASYERTSFLPGDTVYFTAYYRDQLSTLSSQYTIYQPDGSIYDQWTHSTTTGHFAASWWWWSYDLEPQAPTGAWRFEVVFNGQTYTHGFYVIELSEHIYLPLIQK